MLNAKLLDHMVRRVRATEADGKKANINRAHVVLMLGTAVVGNCEFLDGVLAERTQADNIVDDLWKAIATEYTKQYPKHTNRFTKWMFANASDFTPVLVLYDRWLAGDLLGGGIKAKVGKRQNARKLVV
jgi:hypothetical protein